MQLISFSLYGNEPKYVRGLFENLKLKDDIYQNWGVVVFHDDSVDAETIDILKSYGVLLKNMTNSGMLAASWRFCAADLLGCDRFIVRDSDSRISRREEEAVMEWIENDTILHIMRDHPHHGYPMNGGMWGMKNTNHIPKFMETKIIDYQGIVDGKIINQRTNWWMKDMDFLRDVIYKEFATPFSSTIHNGMDFMSRVSWQCESWAKDFPSPIGPEKHFVGEIFVFDENGQEKREYQYKER
jgi:hypothetical protein